MKVEKLALARTYQPAVRSAKVGRVWIKVASGRRRAVSERIAQVGGLGPGDSRTAAKTAPLFDNIICEGEQRRRDRKAERLCGLEVDHQLVLGRPARPSHSIADHSGIRPLGGGVEFVHAA
jgi:hypothetical protein